MDLATDYPKRSLEAHIAYKWKVAISSKVPLTTKDDLSVFYSPWVAAPCLEIAKDPENAYAYTRKGNSVAVISDGSAVLGLGNIGWLAGLPVMEWKAVLMKQFGGIDAIPLVLSTQNPDEIILTVLAVAPTFWAINLEDIAAPACFYIEEELQKQLSIPVFHDDQHGTAIVVLAWLLNSLRLTDKDIASLKVVISGAWAAGIATAKLLIQAGVTHIIMTDSKWTIHSGRTDLNAYKTKLVPYNTTNITGTLQDALIWADVFIGVSQPNIVTSADISTMNKNAFVFALSNPVPEITYEAAMAWGALVYASWRSDSINQINNLLAFPGLLRWALDARLTRITDAHKYAAAQAIAWCISHPTPENVIPSPFDLQVHERVADAVRWLWNI